MRHNVRVNSGQLDFSAFSEPIPKHELTDTVKTYPLILWLAQRMSIWAIVAAMFVPWIIAILLFHDSDTGMVLMLVLIPVFIFFLKVAMTWRTLYDTANSARVKRFASMNSFEHIPFTVDPGLNGSLFGIGKHREVRDQIYGKYAELEFELANYSYETIGHDRESSKETYGYAWITLPRHLPHMVLDSKKNNELGLTSLPISFSRDQKLRLEGNFNKYFTLYCPEEYERDALYIFTPDLMALFIDHGNSFDMEIVDDKLYLYSYAGFDFSSSEDIEMIFEAIRIVGARLKKRSARYADARSDTVTSHAIASQGRRLKRSYVRFIITLAVGILSFLLPILYALYLLHDYST